MTKRIIRELLGKHRPPRQPEDESIQIVFGEGGGTVGNVLEGGTLAFEVIAYNKGGRPVPPKDPVTVTTAAAATATATVQTNGKSGVVTGVAPGDTTITATSGTLTNQQPISVKPDNTPASIAIVFGAAVPPVPA